MITSSLTRPAARPASFQLRFFTSAKLSGLKKASRIAESDRGAGGAAAAWEEVRSGVKAVLAEGAPAWPFAVAGAGFAAGAAGESDPWVGWGSTGGSGAVSSGRSPGVPAAPADDEVVGDETDFAAGLADGRCGVLSLAMAGGAESMAGINSGLGPSN